MAWPRQSIRLPDRGRRRRLPTFRLVALPGQHHSRKVKLMLQATGQDTHGVQFELTGTGSITRLPDERWLRPVEIDLLRYGIGEGLSPPSAAASAPAQLPSATGSGPD